MVKPFSLITQNAKMREILSALKKIAESDYPVLLIAETGSGKEIFADYIHLISSRSSKAMVKIGLAALPPDLMASELFGHEKGAFTGASDIKKGLFEIAFRGTLFLDDVDDVPLSIQAKLLRVLESGEMMRVGGVKPINTDARIIAATKIDLKKLIKTNQFRSDLYYRLNVVPVVIPPLRDRKDDIPLLINHFLKKFAPQKRIALHPDALDTLVSYDWPGNVRELRNVVQRISLLVDDLVRYEDLPFEITGYNLISETAGLCTICFTKKQMNYKEIILCIENKLFSEALKKTDNNQSKAAELLGLSLSTFRDKLKKHLEAHSFCG